MCMYDVWWTSSWVLVGRCVKSQNVPKTILLCINKQSFQHILCQCTLIANIIFGTSYDFTHFPTKTQLLDHHTLDIHIFQPKLPILFLTLDHAQANTLSKYIKRRNYNKKSGNYNKNSGWNYNIFHLHLLLLVLLLAAFLPFPPTSWNFIGLDTPNVLPLNPLGAPPPLPWLGTPLVLTDALGCITKIWQLARWSNNSK